MDGGILNEIDNPYTLIGDIASVQADSKDLKCFKIAFAGLNEREISKNVL